jgi:integrase
MASINDRYYVERHGEKVRTSYKGDLRYQVRWREVANGPQQTKTFRRKVDAEQFATQIEHSKLTGAYVDPSAGKVTLKDYAEKWRARQVWRASTASRTEIALRRHVYPTFGARPMASIRPSELQAWVKGLSEDLAPATVEATYRLVVSIYRAAIVDKIVAVSPAQAIKLPRIDRGKVEPISVAQADALADAISARYGALVHFAAETGLRQGECFGLTVDRVDFLRRTVRVDRQLIGVEDGDPVFGPTKTAASNRTVPVAQTTLDRLAAHLAKHGEGPERLVFPNRYRRPTWRSHFSMTWKDARKRAGVEARFHDLRHHYASTLIAAGCSIKAVQHALGHATAAETLDTYSHLWPDDEDRIREAIAARAAIPAEESLRNEATS